MSFGGHVERHPEHPNMIYLLPLSNNGINGFYVRFTNG